MARFTSIGMPKKSFVASAAEERQDGGADDSDAAPRAGPSSGDKRKPQQGWTRDPQIAKRARQNQERTDERRHQRIADKQAGTTCFACRQRGHAARECPNILEAVQGARGTAALLEADDLLKQAEAVEGAANGEEGGANGKGKKRGKGKDKVAMAGKNGGEITGGKCYRCNSPAHSLSRCPKRADPANPTPFATCFVCLESGHLSAACPKNARGVYVNGGACKLCQSVAHRAKDCPTLHRPAATDGGSAQAPAPLGRRGDVVSTGGAVGADEDDFTVVRPAKRRHEPAKNSMRGPAKRVGDEGAYVPVAKAAFAGAAAKAAADASSAGPAAASASTIAAPRKKPKVVAF